MMMRATQILAFVLIAIRVHGADAPTQIYLNPHHGFSVSLPTDWTRIDDKGNECEALFLTPQEGIASFAGVALEKGVDLDQFEKQSMRQPKPEILINLLGVRNFKLLSSKSAELATVKARLIEFTAMHENMEFKGCCYLAIGNGRGFLLLFQARADSYASEKDAFFKIAKSFKVNTPDGRDQSEFTHKELKFSLKYPATWCVITLKKGWTAFIAPHKAGENCPENIVINAMKDVVTGVAGNHENMVNQGYEYWIARQGVSDGEAPKRVTVGNMQGFRYAFTQITPDKTVVRQECYSTTKGINTFFLVCTATIAKAAAARTAFDAILKSIRADDVPVQIAEQKSERNGFTISYPDNWLAYEPRPDAVAIIYPRRIPQTEYLYEAMASIWADSVDMNFDLDRIAATQKQHDEKEKDYHLEEEKRTELNGVAARRQIYSVIMDKIKIKTLRYMVFGRHRQYVLEFTSPVAPFSVYLNTFEKIAASFKLLPVPKEGESYYLHRVHASLHFPANWKVWEDDKSDRVTIMLNRENLNKQGVPELLVSVDMRQEKLAQGITLQAFTKSMLDELIKEQKDAKVGKKSDLKIDGHEAVETHLTVDTPLGAKEMECYTVLAHGWSYVITGTGSKADFQTHSKTVDEIVRSIQFNEPLPELPVFTEEPKEKTREWTLFEETYTAIRDYLADGEILIPSDLLRQAELGDHFETINLDRQDSHSAFGNPNSHWFHSVKGSDGSDKEYGSYGRLDGGGRKLMVPRLSCDFTQAIMDCVHAGYETRVTAIATKEQTMALAKQIELLVSDDVKQRETASSALLNSGMISVNLEILSKVVDERN